jgi:hypothetical protein
MATDSIQSISIKLLSGDILTIDIRMSDLISSFPVCFIEKYNYNPLVMSRFVFFVEDEDIIEKYQMQTWFEVFGSNEIPMICLFIKSQEESEKEKLSKIQMIHSIINKEKMKYVLSDEELYSLYNEWYLHYIPKEKTNRYLKMKQFVEENPLCFEKWSEEECEKKVEEEKEKERKADEQKKNFEESLRVLELIKRTDERNRFIMMKEEFLREREEKCREEVYRLAYEKAIERASTQSQWDPPFEHLNQNLLSYYLNYILQEELIEMGFPREKVCSCRIAYCAICRRFI